MAKMGDLKLTVDDFIKQTRISFCMSDNCDNYDGTEASRCALRKVPIGKNGVCAYFREAK